MKKITRLFGSLLILLMTVSSCSKETYETTEVTKYVYIVITDSNGKNPSQEGWYTKNNDGTYTKSSDTTAQPGVTYYKQTNSSSETPLGPTISDEIQQADEFAQYALSIYYLWNKEIASAIEKDLDPDTCTDPVATVEKIRYKDGGGYNSNKDEDRWTQLFEDITPFQESVQGVATTNGLNLTAYKFKKDKDTDPQSYFFIVNFVYADSPADKAGLKRGDIILKYKGRVITDANLEDAYYGETVAEYGLGSWKEDGIDDGKKSVTLTPVKMYLNPIISTKTFDVNGKKVGYLMYDSFDLDSAKKLIEVCKQFKSEGVKELILDLRYNGGGYVFTEELMASMFAPAANVKAGELYMQEIYNEKLTYEFTKQLGKNFNKTYLSFDHEMGEEGSKGYVKYNTEDANIGLNKIYAIVDSNTASASESLLVGLSPFIDIVTIGQQSHGKYCTGYILGVDDLYETVPSDISKWGIYVMVATYADRDNKNLARPVGIVPSIEEDDTPWDGFNIGNENETMLKAALQAAGKKYALKATTRSLDMMPRIELKMMHNKYKFGKRIKQLPTRKSEALR